MAKAKAFPSDTIALKISTGGNSAGNGGDGVRMLIGAGERAGIVNPKPSDRPTSKGDVIRVGGPARV